MKQVIKNYTFSTIGGNVLTLPDFTAVRLERLQLVVDTTINEIVYNFVDPAVTATASFNTFFFSSLPVGAAATDALMIFYDCAQGDPTYDVLALPGEVVGTPGAAAPGFATQVAGADGSGLSRMVYVDSAGRLAQFDAGTVATAPLTQAAIAVAVTDTSILPANPSRGEFEVCNFSQTDICLTLGASAAVWGGVGAIIIAPNGYYARAYTGAVRAIHNNTRSGVATGGSGGTTCLLTANEWS